jgi:hypothetical protein
MPPRIPHRPKRPTSATKLKGPDLATMTGRGTAFGLSGAKASIPSIVGHANGDVQGAGRPAVLPTEQAIRRKGGSAR